MSRIFLLITASAVKACRLSGHFSPIIAITGFVLSSISWTYVAAADFEVEVPAGFCGPIRLKDGRLLAVNRVGISGLISSDSGRSWVGSGRLSDSAGRPIGGPRPQRSYLVSVIRLHSGAIGLKFEVPQTGSDHESSKLDSYFSKSMDEGQSWTEPTRVSPLQAPTNATWLIQTRTGRLVLANEYWYTQPDDRGLGVCTVFYSDDEGLNWQESRHGLWVWENGGASQGGCEVPCVVEAANGTLLMLMRTRYQRIAQSQSSDGGATWSPVRLNDLVSSNSEVYLARVPKSDDLLCIWNQASTDEIKNGYYRARLTTAISRDHGKTWQSFRTFASSPGQPSVGRVPQTGPPEFLDTPIAVPLERQILADEFHMNRAPRVVFIGDSAYVTYTHRRYRYMDGRLKREYDHRRLRVVPISWFYGKNE